MNDRIRRVPGAALLFSAPAVALPELTKDAVAYITQNPANPNEYAIATFECSVYASKDAGKTWKQIADRGSGK